MISLAGVASLLNIWIQHESLIPRKQVRAFLYAPPPTFTPAAVTGSHEAIQSSVAFIHKNDTVPFLSVDSIRRLFNLVTVVDQLNIPIWKRLLIRARIMTPSRDIVEACQNARNIDMEQFMRESDEFKSPMVAIPAFVVYWMHEKPPRRSIYNVFGLFEKDAYEVMSCDSTKLVRIGPLLTPGGLVDHLVGKYEYALSNLSLVA
jgi:hypothetical protein